MIYYLANDLFAHLRPFAVFQYLTLRAIMAALTALGISLLCGPAMIRWLLTLKIGQAVRSDGPQTHLSKSGTPTMGGALILLSITITTLLWADLSLRQVWVVLLTTLSFGVIGWVDDYKKVVHRNPKGLASRWKYFWQSVVGLAVALYLYYSHQHSAELELLIPIFKNASITLGIWFVPFVYFVIVGTSNAVNLTDGLDGLAILPCVLIAAALAVFAYVTGHFKFAAYLHFPFIAGNGELIIFCAAIFGAGLGFLWFNAYPATVFMGDVGALALGGALGTIAVLVRQELVLLIMGGLFVMETVSVMIQVASFKLTGKRVFLMAPLHHHFELKGWPESRVIVRFWIITLILVLIGLATLKIR